MALAETVGDLGKQQTNVPFLPTEHSAKTFLTFVLMASHARAVSTALIPGNGCFAKSTRSKITPQPPSCKLTPLSAASTKLTPAVLRKVRLRICSRTLSFSGFRKTERRIAGLDLRFPSGSTGSSWEKTPRRTRGDYNVFLFFNFSFVVYMSLSLALNTIVGCCLLRSSATIHRPGSSHPLDRDFRPPRPFLGSEATTEPRFWSRPFCTRRRST